MQLDSSSEKRKNKNPEDLERFDELLSDYSTGSKQQDDIEALLIRKIEGTQDPKSVQSYIAQLESYRSKNKGRQKKMIDKSAEELNEIKEDLEEIRYLLSTDGAPRSHSRDLSQIFAIVFALVFSLLAFIAMVEMAYLLSLVFFVGALSSLVLAVGPSLVKQWKRLED